MQRILLVGSENLRDSIIPTLRNAAYEIVVAYDDLDLLLTLKQAANFDLVLGDIKSPETLDILQSEYPALPVVILSEQATIASCVQAMRRGIANYLQFPVVKDALLERVEEAISHPRRPDLGDDYVLRVRELTIDRRHSTVHFRDTPIQLTTTQYDILCRLAQDAGNVVAPEVIVKDVYGEEVTRQEARQMLSAHLTNLRAALREAGCEHYLINSFGRGYYIDTSVEETLRQTEGKLRLLLDQLPGNVWTTDKELRFDWVAGSRRQALDLTPDQIIGMTVADLLEDKEETISITAHRSALDGHPKSFEREWRGHYYQCHVEPLRGADDSIVGCIGVSLDISERKLAEERSAFQANVLSQVSDVVIAVDMEGRLTYWNQAAERWFGIKLDDIVGHSMRDAFSDQWISPEDELRMAIGLWENGSWQDELVATNRDGQRVDLEFSISWLKDSEDNPIGILTLMRDITQRKQAEEALRQSEQRFRATFEQAAVGVTHTSPDGKWLRINRKMCDILGYSREELFELDWRTLTHPDDLNISLERTGRLLAGEIETYSLEKRYIRKDGSPIWVNLTSSPVRDSSGIPQYYVAVIEDITERKRAEALLRESEFRYRSIFENALEGIYRSIPGRRLTDVNPAMARMLGYESPAEVIALNIPDELFVDLTEWEHLQQLHRTQDVIEGVELRWKRKDGEPLVVGLYVQTLRDEEGQVMFYEGIVTNITERKRAEEALRQNEERYRIISEMMSDYVYAVSVLPGDEYKTTLEWVAGALETITGFTIEEALSGVEWAERIHPDDLPLIKRRRQALLAGKKDISEFRMINKQGETHWLRAYNQPIWDKAEGRVVRIYAAVQDITERKQIEETLVKERNLLHTIIETVPDQIYVKDLNSRFMIANPKTWQLHKMKSLDELIGKTDLEVFGEAGAADYEAEKLLFATGQPIINEERFTPETLGGPRWSLVTKVPLYDAEKKIIGLVGINRDITERKRIEEALRQSEERYRIISETMSDYVYAFHVESDGKLVLEWITGAYERITGYTVEEVFQGVASTNVIHPDDQVLVAERTERLLSGQSDITECRLITRDGETRHIRLYGSPVWDEVQGRLIRIYASAQDITERKRADEALRKSEKLYQTLVSNLPKSAIVLFDHDLRHLIAEGAALAPAGFNKELVEGRTIWEVLPAEIAEEFEPRYRAALRGEENIVEFEYLGRVYYVHLLPVKDEDGNVFAGMIVVQDITERKQAEEALRKSEANFRKLVEDAPAPMMIFRDTKVIFVNPAIETLSGYTREEWLTMNFYDVIVPEQQPIAIEKALKRQRGEQVRSRYEVKIRHKSGREIWLDYLATAIQFEGDTAVLAIVADITKHKETEKTLRQSEAAVRALIENIPAPLLIFDDRMMRYVNPAAAALIGYTPEEVCQMTYWDMIHPDMRDFVRESGAKRLQGEPIPSRYEVKLITKMGETVWVDYMGTTIQYEGKLAVLGIVFDITGRKQTEAALRQSEEQLRQVIANAPLLVWAVDRDGIFTLFQGRGIKALGLQSHQIVGRCIYESERHDVQEHIERAFAGQIFTATVEIYGVMFETDYAPIYDADGQIVGIMGISLDVTRQ